MAQRSNVVSRGLFTDPNQLAKPSGAMSEALNVVIERPGVVTPRKGIRPETVSWLNASFYDYDIVAIYPYADEVILALRAPGTGVVTFYVVSSGTNIHTVNERKYGTLTGVWTPPSAPTMTGSVTPRPVSVTSGFGDMRAVTARGNLYIATDVGVLRVEGVTARDGETYVYAQRAGLRRDRQPEVLLTSTNSTAAGVANLPIEIGEGAYAVRCCRIRKAGDILVRSAPTGRGLIRWNAVAAEYAQWRLPGGGGYLALDAGGDSVELYRSTSFAATQTAEPTDEMALIGTTQWNDEDKRDETPESGPYGDALYTNETQQGALMENGIPPFCTDVALFNEMVFFAGAQWAPRITIGIRAIGPDDGPTGYDARVDGLTYTAFTGTTTIGSALIADVADTTIYYIRDGMRISLASSYPDIADSVFADGTVSTDATGGIYTPPNAGRVTANANASAAGSKSLVASDYIEIEWTDSGGTYTHRAYAWTSDHGTLQPNDESSFKCAAQTYGGSAAAHLARRLTEATEKDIIVTAFGDGSTEVWDFAFEGYEADLESITIRTSNPKAIIGFEENQYETTVTRDGAVGAVGWTKKGEPEHSPPGGDERASFYAIVGAADKRVERIVPTRDSMFIFKEDGVWRLSGNSPESIRIDEFDRSLRLVHPNAACEINGAVAAWTNRGLLLISDGGVEEIGAPIAQTLRSLSAVTFDGGIFLLPWVARASLLVGFPSADGHYASYIYCYNFRTGSWTRWSHSEQIACAAVDGGDVYFGTLGSTGVAPKLLKITNSSNVQYDSSESITLDSVNTTASTAVVNADSTVPDVGDVVLRGSGYAVVTAVSDHTITLSSTSGITAGAGTLYHMPERTVRWAMQGGSPDASHFWQDVMLTLSGDVFGIEQIEWVFSTDRYSADVTNTQDLADTDYAEGATQAMSVLKRVPRNARSGAHVNVAATIRDLNVSTSTNWAIEAMTLRYEELEPTARRPVA